MAYSDSKDWAKRGISDKVLKVKGYKIAINPMYDEYQFSVLLLGIGISFGYYQMDIGSLTRKHEREWVTKELAQE